MYILFGNSALIGPLVFFGFGLFFTLLISTRSQLKFLFEWPTNWQETNGIVVSLTPLSMEEFGDRVYEVRASFDVNEEQYKATGYVNGRQLDFGQEVTVKYEARKPNNAHLKGEKRAPVSLLIGLIVLIFPAGGLMAFLSVFSKNYKRMRLLQNGTFAEGRLEWKKQIGGVTGGRSVFRCRFRYEVDGKPYQTSMCKIAMDEEVLDGEVTEAILYNPKNPSESSLYSLNPVLKFGRNGKLEQASYRIVVYLFLAAMLFVLGSRYLKSIVSFLFG